MKKTNPASAGFVLFDGGFAAQQAKLDGRVTSSGYYGYYGCDAGRQLIEKHIARLGYYLVPGPPRAAGRPAGTGAHSHDGRHRAPAAEIVVALRVPFAIVPLVNADNNQHASNENMRLGNYVDGVRTLHSLLTKPLR